MNKKIAIFFASACYSGFLPYSPGTWGSLSCLLAWYYILPPDLSRTYAIAVALLTTTFAIFVCNVVIKNSDPLISDPQYIVIDEWAGMLVTLIIVPKDNLQAILLAFMLFRFFDITKPGPVAWAEKLPGAWGIVADDVIAGLFAMLMMLLLAATFSLMT